MPEQKNLCALIPIELHQRVTEEKDRLEQTTSQYITNLITEYYALKAKGGDHTMNNTRTLAFQIPEELFQRIKAHLERESVRLGRKATHEPYTQANVLEYGGKYYIVGSGRQPLQKDKTQREDYYLLTLAAIARELTYRQTERTASVHLAAGLPLTSFGREKKKFKAYLLREGRPVSFRYEGLDYTVTITDVSLFPQGYAAVLTQPGLLDEPSVLVADIGGWTVDLTRLDNRVPDAASCRSLELGMIRCLDAIAEQVRHTLGLSLTAAQIESVLRHDVSRLDEQVKTLIHREADRYVRLLLSAITESGLDPRAMPAVFLGGGAALLKTHFPTDAGLCQPIILDDVCLNAKGYERLAAQLAQIAHGK